jgi:hypothetical protein
MKARLRFEGYYGYSFAAVLVEMAPRVAIVGGVAVLLAALGIIGDIGRGEPITATPQALSPKAKAKAGAGASCECGLWKVSVAAMTAGAALDAASTLGKREMNPLYGLEPGQRFGAKEVMIRTLMPVGIGALERYLLSKPSMRWAKGPLTVLNFVAGGTFTGAAVRNWRIK